MKGWKEFYISEFLSINPKVHLDKEQEFPFVEMKDIDGINRWCEACQWRKLAGGSRFLNGDILFARITPCLENGKIAQVRNLENGKGFGSTEFLVFRGKDNVSDTNFVYYLSMWQDVRDFAEQHMEGTSGRQRVHQECFSDLKLLLPPLSEQRAIASVLSSLDDKIDLLHRQNATLEAMAEALFRQWFVVEAREEWEEKPLSGIAHFLNGLACQKYPPQNAVDRLPVLKIRELNSGSLSDADWAQSTVPEEYIVHDGDVIFSWSGSLMVKIWNGYKCILNQHLFKVTSSCYPKWFYYFWTKYHLPEFVSIAASHATTMGHIKRGDLDAAMAFVPSPNELSDMSKILSPIFAKLVKNSSKIRILEKLRDTLLPKLMSGEVRVDMA